MVLAQDVTDARTFTCADRAQRGRRQHFLLVHDDERRVVLDAGARVERAHEVFGLFTRRRRAVRAESEPFVETVPRAPRPPAAGRS